MTQDHRPDTAARLDATVPVDCDECPRSLGTLDDEPTCRFRNTAMVNCLARIVKEARRGE